MTDDFTGRTLLLTGAAGGIGAAIAREFLRLGANLALSDRRAEDLDALVRTLDGTPGRIVLRAGDAAAADDVGDLVDTAVQAFGALDFVVPCAGVFERLPIEQLTPEAWRRTLGINLEGPFELVRRSLPHFAPDASIVFVSSLAAHRGLPTHAQYAASKGGVVSLTKSLALAFAPQVRVNAVAPGLIETPMTATLQQSEQGRRTLAQTPLGRAGRPAEVASVVRFLCSQDAGYMTGQVLHVNGGTAMVG
ncbi:MAG: 3-oxoacyl-ACP reductase [Actinobacteria bacterium]|uniref:SDR family NAD(P)-dependent oxidoreductase n=1 Tax=Microbacterium sp. NPDC076895 TaxID=3154957 RepID=UPI001002AEB9|nr:MAG: 3-oxoacyl-ACP reductase [Actinomycetota bacterium]